MQYLDICSSNANFDKKRIFISLSNLSATEISKADVVSVSYQQKNLKNYILRFISNFVYVSQSSFSKNEIFNSLSKNQLKILFSVLTLRFFKIPKISRR